MSLARYPILPHAKITQTHDTNDVIIFRANWFCDMTTAPNAETFSPNGQAATREAHNGGTSSVGSPKPAQPPADASIASISLTNAITLLGLLLNLVIAGLIGIYQLYVIPSVRGTLEAQLEMARRRADESEKQGLAKVEELRAQVARLEETRAKALEQTGRPLLLYPKNDEIVISNEITFRWDYKTDAAPQYIIEISKASQDGIKTFTYSVLQPDKRLFHLPVGTFGTGQYLWRVRPGVVLEDKEVSTGPWSAYQSFSVYTSVLEKVLRTGRLTVGMYASFFDRFNSPVAGGKFEGFSVDFARHSQQSNPCGPTLNKSRGGGICKHCLARSL